MTASQVLSPRKKVDALGVPVAAKPVDGGSPVQLVNVPDAGVPKAGLISVASSEPTNAPVPD
jgi:hypothetical protein